MQKIELQQPFSSRLSFKCKFLTRNLLISSKTSLVFRKACIKRFVIKNFIDQRSESHNRTKDSARLLFKAKAFKTLQNISLSSSSRGYLRSHLKICKCLKEFKITIPNAKLEMDKLAIILKKLSRNLRTIDLEDILPYQKTQSNFFYEFARVIRRFPKLECFNRDFAAKGNENQSDFQKELESYNRLALRLKGIKNVYFGFSLSEQYQFRKVMKKTGVYSGIDGLIMRLGPDDLESQTGREVFGLQDYNHILHADIPYNLEDQEHISQILLKDPNTSEEQLNQELLMKHRMREKIKPFFSFDLFPNLKKLNIIQDSSVCTLTSFVGYGFQALKNLQELQIRFPYSRSTNTMILFKQFFNLPLLRKFSLNIPYLKSEEWTLLEQFLKNQSKLEAFYLCLIFAPYTRNNHFKQNASLENLIKSLADKPLLKSLELKSPFWSLEALSGGFSALKIQDQLHTLILEASDDFITSDETLEKRVEGLCHFLKNQKSSLKILKIALPFIWYYQIINRLGTAVSSLNQLRELKLLINSYIHGSQLLLNYFLETLQEGMDNKRVLGLQSVVPDLAKHLQRLENLEDFTIGFELLDESKEEPLEWFIDIMNILPELKWLRRFRIVPRTLPTLVPIEQKMVHAVFQMKNVREIADEFDYYFDLSGIFPKLKEAIRHFNKGQCLRSDLMYETNTKEYAPRYIYF